MKYTIILMIGLLAIYAMHDPIISKEQSQYKEYIGSALQLEGEFPAPVLILFKVKDERDLLKMKSMYREMEFKGFPEWYTFLNKKEEKKKLKSFYAYYNKEYLTEEHILLDTVVVYTEQQKEKISSVAKKYKAMSNKYHGFSYYEIAMWNLVSEESFRTKRYSDGKYSSVGFGFNLHPDNVKLARKYNIPTQNITWEQGKELTKYYLDYNIVSTLKKKYPKENANQWAARICRAYNTGNLSIYKGCCKGSKMCGSSDEKIRRVHNNRRTAERKLFEGKISKKTILQWQKRAASLELEIKNKKHNKNKSQY